MVATSRHPGGSVRWSSRNAHVRVVLVALLGLAVVCIGALVQVELVADGTSTLSVTSDEQLTEAAVAAALDEAGDYRLVTA